MIERLMDEASSHIDYRLVYSMFDGTLDGCLEQKVCFCKAVASNTDVFLFPQEKEYLECMDKLCEKPRLFEKRCGIWYLKNCIETCHKGLCDRRNLRPLVCRTFPLQLVVMEDGKTRVMLDTTCCISERVTKESLFYKSLLQVSNYFNKDCFEQMMRRFYKNLWRYFGYSSNPSWREIE